MQEVAMNNPNYMPYADAVNRLQVSHHPNQLVKRQAKYPGHFIEENGQVFISKVLFEALMDYRLSLQYLITLKKGGSYENNN